MLKGGVMRRFEGRVAVITGTASGIGRATAELLAGRGCDVALVDLNEAGMQKTAERVRSVGAKVSCHVADVSDKARMQALPEEVIREHGHVHILINNAGVYVNGTIEEQTIEDFEWIVGINFWGVVYGCKFFLPYLKREDEAHIVNLSSMYAFIGLPAVGSYCATKSAVRAVSEALWAELAATNIGVTSVHPGVIRTNLVRAGHFPNEERKQRLARRVDRFAPSPERAARKIVRAIGQNKPRLIICPDAYLIEWSQRLFPALTHRLVAWLYRRRAD
jgi:short-subunit dehydrogenase